MAKKEAIKQPEKKRSRAKLILFAVVAALMMFGSSLWGELGPTVWRIFVVPSWRKDFDIGLKTFKDDEPKGRQQIEKAISDAQKSNAPSWEMISMYTDYAHGLYNQELYDEGDKKIDRAIALCPNPDNDKRYADILGMTYQERARASLDRFSEDRKPPVRTKDQEESLRLTERAFGPQSTQVIHKLSLLAVLYATDGDFGKANETMRRAITTADTRDHSVLWYVYGLGARMKAVEHEYKDAASWYLKARAVAPDDEQTRIWNDFQDGLTQSVPPIYTIGNVQKWLQQHKFQQLETLTNELRKSKAALWDGQWRLDWVYEELSEPNKNSAIKSSEPSYMKRLAELKQWVKEFPNSISARIALADFYTDYAYHAHESHWTFNTPEYRGDNLEKALLLSKSFLDADPKIEEKCPRSFTVYTRLIKCLPDKGNKLFWANLNRCHKMWPDYKYIDLAVLKNLLPYWRGKRGEVKQFINSRANSVGGAAGDAYFAILTNRLVEIDQGEFEGLKSAQWKRVQRGFHQIFKEHPSDVQARLGYFVLALWFDQATILNTFDGFVVPQNDEKKTTR